MQIRVIVIFPSAPKLKCDISMLVCEEKKNEGKKKKGELEYISIKSLWQFWNACIEIISYKNRMLILWHWIIARVKKKKKRNFMFAVFLCD